MAVSFQADAVAVLVGDLAAGVDDQELGVVVGELELLDGEQAVDADAAGHVVDEAGDDRAGGAVDRHQADPGGAVHGLEVAAHVQGGVGGGEASTAVTPPPPKVGRNAVSISPVW
jgi:hypothetical protein